MARRDPASRSVSRGSHAPAPARSARTRPSSTGPAVVATTARTVPSVRRAATSRPSTVIRASTRGRAGSVTSTCASTVRWGPMGPAITVFRRAAGAATGTAMPASPSTIRRPPTSSSPVGETPSSVSLAIRRGAGPEASATSTAPPAMA